MIACFIKNDKDLLLIRAHGGEMQRCAFKAQLLADITHHTVECNGEELQIPPDESSQKGSQKKLVRSASHLILTLHSITLPASEVLRNYGCHPGAVPQPTPPTLIV